MVFQAIFLGRAPNLRPCFRGRQWLSPHCRAGSWLSTMPRADAGRGGPTFAIRVAISVRRPSVGTSPQKNCVVSLPHQRQSDHKHVVSGLSRRRRRPVPDIHMELPRPCSTGNSRLWRRPHHSRRLLQHVSRGRGGGHDQRNKGTSSRW